MKKFRTLRADEIDCRLATVTKKGVSLLLYKDARCDMNILDETVGPENWQRRHTRDNANCIVSIWDYEKEQWVEKEDTGTESNAEKEKGLASDSFKRACFNWGIGRELYTAPFICIPAGQFSIEETNYNGKAKYNCRDKFYVSQIGYGENGSINALEIKCKNRTVYALGKDVPEPSHPAPDEPKRIKPEHANAIYIQLQRTGIGIKDVLRQYGLDDIREMTITQFDEAIDILKGKPDKPLDPATIPPDNDADEELPWNTPER